MSSQWICPSCGRRLRVANQEHACGHFDLESHFEGKDLVGWAVLDWIAATIGARQPFDILPMKTMIGFQARSNFAFIRAMKVGVELSLVVSGPVSHPLLTRMEPYSGSKSFARFRIYEIDETDGELTRLLLTSFAECS